MSKDVVLATGNAGKVRELQFLLADCELNCRPQTDFSVPEAVEDGLTFVENALKKARNACEHTGLPAIADDSGLEVAALQGRPGIYSARYCGADATDERNVALLLENMRGFSGQQRAARFVCVMVYLRFADDPVPIVCTGTWDGTILESPRGHNGFGYDPVFLSPEFGMSAAQLDKAQKSAISHRGKALNCLVSKLN